MTWFWNWSNWIFYKFDYNCADFFVHSYNNQMITKNALIIIAYSWLFCFLSSCFVKIFILCELSSIVVDLQFRLIAVSLWWCRLTNYAAYLLFFCSESNTCRSIFTNIFTHSLSLGLSFSSVSINTQMIVFHAIMYWLI